MYKMKKFLKKLVFCVGAVAIVAMTAFNVNLAFNSDDNTNVTFGNVLSVAQNEYDIGNCDTQRTMYVTECLTVFEYQCISGTLITCGKGVSGWNHCISVSLYNDVRYGACP